MTEHSDLATLKREMRAQVIATLAVRDSGFDAVAPLAVTCEITSQSPAQLWRKVADGTFPQPVVLSPGRRGWLMSEIQSWIADRKAERDAGLTARRSPQLDTDTVRAKVIAARRSRMSADDATITTVVAAYPSSAPRPAAPTNSTALRTGSSQPRTASAVTIAHRGTAPTCTPER